MTLYARSPFCVKPFIGLSVTPSGGCAPCCLYERMISKPDGSMFKIWEDGIDQVFNSAFMQDLRKKMLAGTPDAGCRQCYQVEAHGGVSLRNISNTFEHRNTHTFNVVQEAPKVLDLKLNNKCNLKCRMCQPRDSSLIEREFKAIGKKDPSFQFYSNANLSDPDLQIPIDEIPDWSSSPEFMEKFGSVIPGLEKICLVGGEPLLLDEVYKIFEACIAAGRARQIQLVITSNTMHVPMEKLVPYLTEFRHVSFIVSLDATGDALKYIRYPSDEAQIVNNMRALNKVPSVYFQFAPTVQVYNVLYLEGVYRLTEALLKEGIRFAGIPVQLNFLEFPVQLNVRILPDDLRAEAIARIRRILDQGYNFLNVNEVRANLLQLIQVLETERMTNHDYLPEFLYYSAALDAERNQSGEKALPELFSFLKSVTPAKPVESFHLVRERGWKLAREGRLSDAIQEFEKAVQTSTNKDLDYREMAWMSFALGETEKAHACYEKAFALNTSDPYVLKGLALSYHQRGEAAKLRGVLGAALAANPEDEELTRLMSGEKV